MAQDVDPCVAIARHGSEAAMNQHQDMAFFDGWGTVADQQNAFLPRL